MISYDIILAFGQNHMICRSLWVCNSGSANGSLVDHLAEMKKVLGLNPYDARKKQTLRIITRREFEEASLFACNGANHQFVGIGKSYDTGQRWVWYHMISYKFHHMIFYVNGNFSLARPPASHDIIWWHDIIWYHIAYPYQFVTR